MYHSLVKYVLYILEQVITDCCYSCYYFSLEYKVAKSYLGRIWVFEIFLWLLGEKAVPLQSIRNTLCTTLLISGQPGFLKFAHKMWIWEMVNPFGKHLWKFAIKGSFFQKGQFLSERHQRLRTWGRDICEMITNLGKSQLVGMPTECWLSICSVGINSVIPLACRVRTRSILLNARSRVIYILKKL